MHRKFGLFLVCLMVAIAGCHGGGGGGGGESTEESLSLVNNGDLYNSVEPRETATVEADADGDDVGDVTLSYTVYDRDNSVAASDEVTMGSGSGTHSATIPGYPAGYEVQYEVRLDQTDGDSDLTESDSYTVQYIDDVSGPSGGEEVSAEQSRVVADLHATEDVHSVDVQYTLQSGSYERTKRWDLRPTEEGSSQYDGQINNDLLPVKGDHVSVQYQIIVDYGDGKTTTSQTYEYTYTNPRSDILYVPVEFTDSEGPTVGTFRSRSRKASEYFGEVSDGRYQPSYEWQYSGDGDGYYDLPGAVGDYSSSAEIACDAYYEIKDDVDQKKYESVVFVTSANGMIVRASEWGPAFTKLTNGDCMDLRLSVPDSTIVMGKDDKFPTYAHELGHGLKGWGDYYIESGKDHAGQFGQWGLMGRGTGIGKHPSIVNSYHQLQEGWIDDRRITPGDLEEGHSTWEYIPNLQDETSSEERVVVYDADGWLDRSLYVKYYFEARQFPDTDLPGIDMELDPLDRNDGLVAYAETDDSLLGEKEVYLVQNASGDTWQPTIAADERRIVHDPDLGVQFELIPHQTDDDGVGLRIERHAESNLQGVNVKSTVDSRHCEEDGSDYDCSETAPSEDERANIGVVAVSDEGRVGVTADGEVVNEIPGSYVVNTGAVKKVYVPRNVSARFVINASNIDDNASVNLTTQTVLRDENGDRIASELENDSMAGGTTESPELARLNVSRNAWDAGDLRTLKGNETAVTVRNRGIAALENVSVSTEADWLSVNRTAFGTMNESKRAGLGLDVSVPGGKPVGTYTANVTVSADGTKTTQTEQVEVTVQVLPTVYWEASPAAAQRTLATQNETTVVVTVANSEDSNVPLRDVESTVNGDVTAFDIDAPTFVETVQPGASTDLVTTVSVPAGGIAEGHYAGHVNVDPMEYYGRYFDYSVPVPEDYSVTDRTHHRTDVSVDAYGPSVESSAEFHPGKQTAMRKGAATERVTVDPVDSAHDVPAEAVSVRATIPEGWEFQQSKRGGKESALKVWIVDQTGPKTPSGNSGERVKLDPDDYAFAVADGEVVVHIDDLRDTAYGEYMTDEQVLEFEFKLNKDPKASDYGYTSQVDAETKSPWAIYRYESPVASIDVFDAPETKTGPVANVPDHAGRVQKNAIRAGEGEGEDVTLVNPRSKVVEIDGEDTRWTAFDVEGTQSKKTVWVPLEERNGTLTIDAEGVRDGNVVVEAMVTRNIQGALSSGLQDGKAVTLELPAADGIESVDSLEPGEGSLNTSAEESRMTLETPGGETAVEMAVALEEAADGSIETSIPAVAGNGAFDGDLDERGNGAAVEEVRDENGDENGEN